MGSTQNNFHRWTTKALWRLWFHFCCCIKMMSKLDFDTRYLTKENMFRLNWLFTYDSKLLSTYYYESNQTYTTYRWQARLKQGLSRCRCKLKNGMAFRQEASSNIKTMRQDFQIRAKIKQFLTCFKILPHYNLTPSFIAKNLITIHPEWKKFRHHTRS